MPIHACQHLYFASIDRSQAEIIFAFHNGFPIIRFICTIVTACSNTIKKSASSPMGPEDAIVHAVLS